MAFGYVQDLISDGMPDPISYYKEFVKQKNEERASAFAEENRPRAFASPVEYNIGYFLLKTLLEELDVKGTIDILASQMRFRFNVYDMMAQLIFLGLFIHALKPKLFLLFFPIFTTVLQSRKIRFTMDCPLSAPLTKNTLNSLITVMSSTIKEISVTYFLTVRIIISRSIFPAKISRKVPPRRTGMLRSSGRHFSLMPTCAGSHADVSGE